MQSGNSVAPRHAILAVVLLAAIALQCVTSLLTESAVVDEPNYIAGGVTFLSFGREAHRAFYMGEHHPPLGYLCNALPVLFMEGLNYPPDDDDWLGTGVWDFGDRFLFSLNMERSEEIVHRCRLVTVFFSVMLGLLVFHLARRLHGTDAGLFALFLYSFSPTVLGLSRYAVLDVCAAFFMVLALCAFHEFLLDMRPRNVAFAGVAFGLAQLGKYSALLLAPSFVILLAVRLRRGGGAGIAVPMLKLCAVFLIGFAVVWAGYGFDAGSLSDVRKIDPFVSEAGGAWYFPDAARRSMGTFREGWLPLTAYLRGLWNLTRHAGSGHPAFLLGRVSARGWWYYYPAAFLLKTPIPILLLLSARMGLSRRLRRGEEIGDLLLLVPVGMTFLASFWSSQNIGVRHILLVYPLLHAYIGGLAAIRLGRPAGSLLLRSGITLASLWYLWGSLAIWPHYLAYFNEAAGGAENGYRCLVDSNLDWGQDLKGLKRYMDAHGIETVLIDYLGLRGCLEYYGINHEPLRERLALAGGPEGLPAGSIVAVSATARSGVWDLDPGKYAWFDRHEPVGNVGYSIFIYSF
ncbi:MAG: glycosyltransferase family 39 protein [bacterium]|nr:glycosyltransferase family 39 protein [bacterium]